MKWSQHMVSVEEVERIVGRFPPTGWLSVEEQHYYGEIGDKSTALSWLGGRWCAKQLLRSALGVADSGLPRIHIASRNGRQQRIRPWVFLDGQLQSGSLSIAHSSRLATAVLMREQEGSIGVDVSDPKSDASEVQDFWFTSAELAWCELGVSPRVVWSLKEAIYKAVNQGEPFRPRALDVSEWLTTEECLQIGPSGGSLCCSRLGAEVVWRSIRNSPIVVVAIPHCSSSDVRIPAQQNKVVLAS